MKKLAQTLWHSSVAKGETKTRVFKIVFCHGMIPVWNSLSHKVLEASFMNQFKTDWISSGLKICVNLLSFHSIFDEQDLVCRTSTLTLFHFLLATFSSLSICFYLYIRLA